MADKHGGAANQPRQQPQRRGPGRPRMHVDVHVEEAKDKASLRKARTRLAQRAYRSRKEQSLAAAKIKSARLDAALEQTLASFTRFHEFVVGLSTRKALPPELILRLGTTAVEITSTVHDARKEGSRGLQGHGEDGRQRLEPLYDSLVDHGGSFASQDHYGGHGADEGTTSADGIDILEEAMPLGGPHEQETQTVTTSTPSYPSSTPPAILVPKSLDWVPLERQLTQACYDRSHALLSGGIAVEHLIPFLRLPLKISPREKLIAFSRRISSRTGGDLYIGDFQFPPAMARKLPKMYRVVEGGWSDAAAGRGNGGTLAVPRSPPPGLQQLGFARTRTILATDDPLLQGEWLEASDVQEYLEERGIQTGIGHVTNQQRASDHSGSGSGESFRDAIGALGGLTRDELDFFKTNPLDHTFGYYTVPPSSLENQAAFGNMMAELASSPAPTQPAKITINLDKLLESLVTRSVCLGPAPGIKRDAVDLAIRESMVSDV